MRTNFEEIAFLMILSLFDEARIFIYVKNQRAKKYGVFVPILVTIKCVRMTQDQKSWGQSQSKRTETIPPVLTRDSGLP